MIVFDLKCDNGHVFEAWFKSSSAYDEQKTMGVLTCPHCGSLHIEKAVMAPHVAAKSNRHSSMGSAHFPSDADPKLGAAAQMMGEAFEKMRKHVEDNFDYVGTTFADEARAMHYGEKKERGIYGETTLEEREELADEGIDVVSLPIQKKPVKLEN